MLNTIYPTLVMFSFDSVVWDTNIVGMEQQTTKNRILGLCVVVTMTCIGHYYCRYVTVDH